MGFYSFDKLNIKQAFTFRRKALFEDATLRSIFLFSIFIYLFGCARSVVVVACKLLVAASGI